MLPKKLIEVQQAKCGNLSKNKSNENTHFLNYTKDGANE
jgi:hypothetical protein